MLASFYGTFFFCLPTERNVRSTMMIARLQLTLRRTVENFDIFLYISTIYLFIHRVYILDHKRHASRVTKRKRSQSLLHINY